MIALFFFHLGLASGLSLPSWLGPLGLLACSDPCLAAHFGAHSFWLPGSCQLFLLSNHSAYIRCVQTLPKGGGKWCFFRSTGLCCRSAFMVLSCCVVACGSKQQLELMGTVCSVQIWRQAKGKCTPTSWVWAMSIVAAFPGKLWLFALWKLGCGFLELLILGSQLPGFSSSCPSRAG